MSNRDEISGVGEMSNRDDIGGVGNREIFNIH